MKLKNFGLIVLALFVGILAITPVLAATFEPVAESVEAVPYVPVPSVSEGFGQDTLLTIVGLLLPWLVIIVRWILARLGWPLSGNNTKLLVAVLSGAITIVVMVVYRGFGDVHGFWPYVVAIVSRLGIVIGMSEVVYGQIIARIAPLNDKISEAVKVK